MTVKQLIKILEKYDSDINVTIHVPGDDVGYWPLEKESQFVISYYADTNEKVLEITIYD